MLQCGITLSLDTVIHVVLPFAQALILRNFVMCHITSIGFELIEYTFTFHLPNFNECWWDHVRAVSDVIRAAYAIIRFQVQWKFEIRYFSLLYNIFPWNIPSLHRLEMTPFNASVTRSFTLSYATPHSLTRSVDIGCHGVQCHRDPHWHEAV